MIIDIHTHVFPEAIAAKTLQFLSEKGGGLVRYSDGTLTGLMAGMQAAGIDLSVTQPIVTRLRTTASIDRFAASQFALPGILPFAGLHPMQEDVFKCIDALADQGFRGIKFHPEYQGFDIDSPEAIRAIRYLQQRGMVVLIHAGKDVGFPNAHRALPDQMQRMLYKVDASRVIAAHGGGWACWDEVCARLGGSGVYIDTAVVSEYCEPHVPAMLLEAFGADHVLFGSDSPWSSPAEAMARVRTWPLSEAELQGVLGGHAQRLLNLD